MFKAVLFDLDGVIADTAIYHFKAWRNLVKNNFDATLPDKLEEKTKGVSREDSLRVILDYLGVTVTTEEFVRLADEKNNEYVLSLKELQVNDILPGISNLIKELREKNIKLALASASKNAPLILDKLGLIDSFNAIVDPSLLKAGKPAPDIFLKAAELINVPIEECLGIEDAISGIESIKASGAFPVGVGVSNFNKEIPVVNSTDDLTFSYLSDVWIKYR